jgi:hypothetical protein
MRPGFPFALDGKHIVTANWNYYDAAADRSVLIWDSKAQREVDCFRLLDIERAGNVDNSPTQLAFTIAGRYLAFENQGVLPVWDMLARREIERSTSQYTTQLAFSPFFGAAGPHASLSGQFDAVRQRNLESGSPVSA